MLDRIAGDQEMQKLTNNIFTFHTKKRQLRSDFCETPSRNFRNYKNIKKDLKLKYILSIFIYPQHFPYQNESPMSNNTHVFSMTI